MEPHEANRSPRRRSFEAAARAASPGLAALAVLAVLFLGVGAALSRAPSPANGSQRTKVMSTKQYKKPSAAELKKELTPMQFEITQNAGTEPPFRNEFWNNHEAGLYVDVATGEPLFSSTDKFDSGTGWPSFTQPVEPQRVSEHRDVSHGMVRVEVRSHGGDSHLGHVFDDGPGPTNLRYCINSASLRFIPAAKLETEGYGAYCVLFGETAILSGGCFWGMQEILRKIPGVVSTEVGYTGGRTDRPTYADVHTGDSGHAEAVRIVFDPQKLSYDDLLEKWFFRMHDPTTRNRQGNDIGSQYRSAIFVTSAEQRKVAELARDHAQKSGRWKSPIVTQIVEAGPFTPAEDYHQKYLEKNPGGYTCHYLRN